MLLLTDQSFRLFTAEETCGNTCDSCGALAPLLVVQYVDGDAAASCCEACDAAVAERGFVGWWEDDCADDDYGCEDDEPVFLFEFEGYEDREWCGERALSLDDPW